MKLTKRINLCFMTLLVGIMVWSCSDDNASFDQQEKVERNEVEICVVDTSTHVPQKLAEKVANNFLTSIQRGATRNVQEIQEIELIKDDAGNPSFYIVNYQNENDFVVISATQKYIPVLAYRIEGHFDVTNMEQSSVISWIQMQKRITQNIEEAPDSCKQLFSQMWTEYNVSEMKFPNTRGQGSEIEELIRTSVTQWNQEGYEVYTMNSYMYSIEYRNFSSEEQEAIVNGISKHANTDYGDVYTQFLRSVGTAANIEYGSEGSSADFLGVI